MLNKATQFPLTGCMDHGLNKICMKYIQLDFVRILA